MTREQITVAEAETGERLDRVLATGLPGLSRSRLKKLIETGQVSSEGATISDPSLRVKGGQSFTVDLPAPGWALRVTRRRCLTGLIIWMFFRCSQTYY